MNDKAIVLVGPGFPFFKNLSSLNLLLYVQNSPFYYQQACLPLLLSL